MSYVYHISFNLDKETAESRLIRSKVERVMAYMKALLPGEPGFITIRVMYSVSENTNTHLIFESSWDTWDDIKKHQKSNLLETKVLKEFEEHLQFKHLRVALYREY